jgi:NADPH:quinone reductase-like Zn-dependent oxidoreductase
MLRRALPQLAVPTPYKGLAPELRGQIKARKKKLLIIGGGGGVGSWAIQIGSKLCGLEVTATASHPESQAWCSRLGAQSVIDHSQVPTLPLSSFDYILSLSDSIDIAGLARIIKPFGKVSYRFPRCRRDLERKLNILALNKVR